MGDIVAVGKSRSDQNVSFSFFREAIGASDWQHDIVPYDLHGWMPRGRNNAQNALCVANVARHGGRESKERRSNIQWGEDGIAEREQFGESDSPFMGLDGTSISTESSALLNDRGWLCRSALYLAQRAYCEIGDRSRLSCY